MRIIKLKSRIILQSEKRDHLLQEAMKIENNYAILVNIISKRTRQLYSGSKPLIDYREDDDNLYIALREFVEGKISVKPIEL